MTTRVMVNGATGKMGLATVNAIQEADDFELVAGLSQGDDLKTAIKGHKPEVVIDFTNHAVAYQNAKTIIESDAHAVIGTSGFQVDQIKELTELAAAKKLGSIIAPNFAIGVVLMMITAQKVAEYLPHAEIIEIHRHEKEDAPSGTAMKTAELIAESRKHAITKYNYKDIIPGSRGANKDDVPIHAVRLPGFIAKQEIIFGGHGENLTISHDTLSREAFMPGVLLACRKVKALDTLVYGLEHIL